MADLYRRVDLATLSFTARNSDGSGNNSHGGQVLDTYDRATAPSYPAGSDGSAWQTPTLGGPREISDKVMSTDAEIVSRFGTNELFQFIGQLITHDVASAGPGTEAFGFDGDAFGGFVRDAFQIVDGVRAPVDLQTSFLDLSQVYGPNDTLADLLREEDSGRFITGPGHVLPKFQDILDAHAGLTQDGLNGILAANGFFGGAAGFPGFIAGDARVNQQTGLSGGQTLLMLNHNWHADQIAALHPEWSDDAVFDMARAMNEAEWQHVVYDEYVAKLVGADALGKYHGYRANVDPSIINEWTTAAFRFGHDEASNDTSLTNEDGSVFQTISLADNFGLSFGGQGITADPDVRSLEQWLRGFMERPTQAIDGKVANGVRDSLFGAAGVDLAAIDIVRGDDHGVGSLNLVRQGLGLAAYASFTQFGNRNHVDGATLAALREVYDNDIGKLDTEVGGLFERKVKGSQLGETFTILNVMQFENMRDGDKDFYLERFKGHQDLLDAINHTSMADIIARVTGIEYVYHDAFAAADRIGGDGGSNVLNGTGKGDLILGFRGMDRLRGHGGDDDLWGGAQRDDLFGDGGNDRIYGEAGNDILRGGNGADILSGGLGNDNLWGNGGRDTFVFVRGGTDHVRDFHCNELIDLSEHAEFQRFADVRAHMTRAGDNVVIALDDGVIVLDHFNIHNLGAGNFVYSDILDHLA
jgi:peroxidase